MRISSNQLANLVKQSVANNTEKLYRAQETVSTQKLVNRPSDDPVAMGRILGYRTTLNAIEQYVRNIGQAKTTIEFSETQVEEVHSQLQLAKNMAISIDSDDETTRQQTAEDIQNIIDRLMDIGNTKLGDNYIFAGYQTGPEPVDCAVVSCLPESELNNGQYFTIGGGSGYYVWYNIDGAGTDPAPAGMTGIEVSIATGDTASEVAAKTVSAIDGTGNLSCSATNSDPSRIEILDDGNPPAIADNSTGFEMQAVKFEETAPLTACAEVSFSAPADIDDGDYFALGSDCYVWYDTDGDGNGDPALTGKNPIRVDISSAASADDVADLTAQAIAAYGGGSVFEASVTTEDTTRIAIASSDGSLPEMKEEMDTAITLHTVKYNGDDGQLNVAVSKTLKIRTNVTGNEVFTGEGLSDGVNVFDALKALKDALEAPTYDESWISNTKDDLITGTDQVEKAAVDLSVAYTRMESTESYWDRFKLDIENTLSETEDADLAQAIVALQLQETAYEAALAASAELFDKTLMDFLR